MKNKSIILSLLVSTLLFSETNTTVESCVLESSQAYGYTGDVSGKRVHTKEEFTYLCTKTTTERGECNNWETETETLNIDYLEPKKIYYETEDYSGSMGAMLSITQAYDKINGLWSGWHGLCMYGMDDGNWDWLSDPYVLASYALTAYGANSAAEAQSAAQSANYAGNAGMSSAAAQGQIAAAQYAKNQIVQYSICAARAGLDVSKIVEEYEDDGEPCDPVDEFCEEESGEIDSEIFTLPESKLNDMLNNNPDMEKYVKVIKGQGTGTVTIKVINPGSNTDNSGDMAAAKEAAQKIKELMLKVRSALMAIQLASCVASSGSNAGGQSQTADPTSAQNLSVMAVGMANPMMGMALDIAANTYASLQKIDTCSNEDDAKEKGTRYISTLKAKALGQCHHIEDVTSGGGGLGLNKRTRKRYCCYDDKITRIMVEQSKAQLGKDWQHCTDISLKELQFLNFQSCDPVALDNGVDGTKLSAYAKQADRFGAYQYQNKCIDTREYINYMKETFGGEDMLLDTSDIESTLEVLQ
jgi:hypothetical protein